MGASNILRAGASLVLRDVLFIAMYLHKCVHDRGIEYTLYHRGYEIMVLDVYGSNGSRHVDCRTAVFVCIGWCDTTSSAYMSSCMLREHIYAVLSSGDRLCFASMVHDEAGDGRN